MKTTTSLFSRQALTIFTLGIVSITTSFAIGMHSSGTVKPFTLIEAGGATLKGDVNSDTMVNSEDVILILEMVAEYKPVSPEAYNADPNQDGRITIDDAISVLRSIK